MLLPAQFGEHGQAVNEANYTPKLIGAQCRLQATVSRTTRPNSTASELRDLGAVRKMMAPPRLFQTTRAGKEAGVDPLAIISRLGLCYVHAGRCITDPRASTRKIADWLRQGQHQTSWRLEIRPGGDGPVRHDRCSITASRRADSMSGKA